MRTLKSILASCILTLPLSAMAAELAPPTRPHHPDIPWQTPTSLGTAAYAKIMCSAVFLSGRQVAEAQLNSAWFLQPEPDKKEPVTVNIDEEKKRVTATVKGVTRTAAFYGDQGCIIHAENFDGIHFKPVPVKSALPPAEKTPWPMGDAPSGKPYPKGLDKAKVAAAVDKAFLPEALTHSVVVLYKGEILAEKYALNVTKDTQSESWSMGKAEMSTLTGVAIQMGAFKLEDPVPVAEWHKPGDPRSKIRVMDSLRMSSGLSFTSLETRGYDEALDYSDHFFLHAGAINAYKYAVSSPVEFAPNTVGRYRNVDPMTMGYIVRQFAEKNGEEWLTWPQRHLFDKIGIRHQILETDPYGNFLISTFDYGTARNWARMGQLYIQDGMFNGQRVLPEGYAKFVSTPAPAWANQEYGGFFRINTHGRWKALPKDAYFMTGAGGQTTIIIPSHEMVVVRMGHQRGGNKSAEPLNEALAALMPLIDAAQKAN